QNQQHRVAGMKAVAEQQRPVAEQGRQERRQAGGIGKMNRRQRMQRSELEQNLGGRRKKCANDNQPGRVERWTCRVFRDFGEGRNGGGTAHEFGSPGSSLRITVSSRYNEQ